jgi:hypothetical protein
MDLTITMVKDLLPPPKPSPIANGDSKTCRIGISLQSRRWFGNTFVRKDQPHLAELKTAAICSRWKPCGLGLE